MYPKLFGIIENYYVIWGAALCFMILWTRRRASHIYGISSDDASDILRWVLFGVFLGAMIGGYMDHWRRYANDPARILRFWESGLSSGPGFIGGGLFGVYKIKRLGLSVNRFAESSSLPCAFMLAIGRWGCFLNGCCRGLPTDSIFGVAFPNAPDVAVWPSQIFESAASLFIGIALFSIEKKRLSRGASPDHAALFPMFLILYGLYRTSFDFLREGDVIFFLGSGQYSGLIALIVGIIWLVRSRVTYARASS
ncbi:MAG: prolipoprotein diacylglyceryl transferase [Synergistaceae bacterium]|jgi:phosphatidylglycerol:prolipoprotein diacylglycerol transferase|nr:prolipoprotein diacylglyceryl transferase [Synergistaceae bacterium]